MSTAKKLKASQKARDKQVIALRAALFAEGGGDKDVTAGITSAFMKYDRYGCDFVIDFSAKLSVDEYDWAFDLVKSNMESIYDASGYGWDDEDKQRELVEDGARFLLVREKAVEAGTRGKLVAFCHFRFTVQGDVMDVMVGDPCIYLWDIQVEDPHQRKGLGKHLLTLLSLIGTREKMLHLCLPIQMYDDRSRLWVESVKGFAPDKSLKKLIGFDSEMEGFEVYSKVLGKPAAAASSDASRVAAVSAVCKASLSPPALPAPSTASASPPLTAPGSATSDEDLEESEYDIVTKEEVEHVNAEGEEEEGEEGEEGEEELSQDEIVAGLQLMFTEKHGRAADEGEVQQWLDAISELNDAK